MDKKLVDGDVQKVADVSGTSANDRLLDLEEAFRQSLGISDDTAGDEPAAGDSVPATQDDQDDSTPNDGVTPGDEDGKSDDDADAQDGSGKDDKDTDGDASDEEKKLQSLIESSDDMTELVKKITAAAEANDNAQLAKLNKELLMKNKEFESESALWRKQAEKLAKELESVEDEKFVSDVTNSRRTKVYDTVMDDEALKRIVALKQKAGEDPAFKEELEEAIAEFYEGVTGVSIADVVQANRRKEKEAMAGTGEDVPGAADASGAGGFGDLLSPL